MSDYRYNHTLSVVKECKDLAKLFGIDEEKLVNAAYLHDITKEMPIEKQLRLCETMGIEVDADTLRSPKTLHSFTAPALIMRDFPQYADKEVLSAVRYHTTGRADMTLLEKIIFIADYLEPNRNEAENLPLVRSQVFCNIDDALCTILKDTLLYLDDSDKVIDPMTLETYNFYMKQE